MNTVAFAMAALILLFGSTVVAAWLDLRPRKRRVTPPPDPRCRRR